MTEVDLVNLGSYTELPGGNIKLPRGYTSILGPIVTGIPEACILKGHPVKQIHWKYVPRKTFLSSSSKHEKIGDFF
jgi:hypothetical protein